MTGWRGTSNRTTQCSIGQNFSAPARKKAWELIELRTSRHKSVADAIHFVKVQAVQTCVCQHFCIEASQHFHHWGKVARCGAAAVRGGGGNRRRRPRHTDFAPSAAATVEPDYGTRFNLTCEIACLTACAATACSQATPICCGSGGGVRNGDVIGMGTS